MSRAVAGGLAARGVKKGDVMAIYIPNMPEYFGVVYGTLLIGAVGTLVNPAYGNVELEHALRLTEPTHVFTAAALLPTLEEAMKAVGSKAQIVMAGGGAGGLPFEDLLKPGGAFVECTDPDALALLPYSSGTTGLPKGVMLAHRHVVANMHQVTSDPENLAFTEHTVLLAVLPFFHIYGFIVFLVAGPFSASRPCRCPSSCRTCTQSCLRSRR